MNNKNGYKKYEVATVKNKCQNCESQNYGILYNLFCLQFSDNYYI